MHRAWVPDFGSPPRTPSELQIGEVKINGLWGGSSFSIGPALQVGTYTQNKRTVGSGILCGDWPTAPSVGGVLYDPDIWDFPTQHA